MAENPQYPQTETPTNQPPQANPAYKTSSEEPLRDKAARGLLHAMETDNIGRGEVGT